MNGMPAQQAFDRVNNLLRDCYRDWYLALAGLPQWGEKIDAQAQKYVQGVQDVVLANLNWRFVPVAFPSTPFLSPFLKKLKPKKLTLAQSLCSFKSQRYLGKAHDVVRRTRQITVMPRPERAVATRPGERALRWAIGLSAKLYGKYCLFLVLLASLALFAFDNPAWAST